MTNITDPVAAGIASLHMIEGLTRELLRSGNLTQEDAKRFFAAAQYHLAQSAAPAHHDAAQLVGRIAGNVGIPLE